MDACTLKEWSPILWVVHEEEEAKSMALSWAKWRVCDKIREATRIDARLIEIIKLILAQGDGIVGFKVRDDLIYYK